MKFEAINRKMGKRKSRATAAILAAVIIFGMMFSVTASYFYLTGLQRQAYQQALKAQSNNVQVNKPRTFKFSGHSFQDKSRFTSTIPDTQPL